MQRLESAPQAEDALQRVYDRWFGLTPQEREHLSPVRPWLTRLIDRTCSDIARSAPRVGPVGIARSPQRPVAGQARRPSAPVPDRHDGIIATLASACRSDDRLALDALLAPAVTALVDGGGRLRVDPTPARGSAEVSRVLRALLGGQPELAMTGQSVNGATGLVVHHDQAVVAVLTLEIVGDRGHQVCVVLNPDKLRSWNRG
jgi:RNA polymerase sigma-70 factor (ECF subfamily)